MQLVTWNTQWCRGLDGRVDPARIVQGARSLGDFDALCLQEIAQGFDGMPGAPGDQPAQIEALLPGFRVFFGAAVDDVGPDGRPMRFGNLVATRLPVLHVQHHALPWPADAGVRSMPRMCTVVTVADPQLGPVRVMTTHLEYDSKPQRSAQALALRALHAEACAHAATPPLADDRPSPFRAKAHTPHAILCGDFNFQPSEPEYAAIQAPCGDARLHDAWRHVHGTSPHAPTFCLFDRTYGPEPIACDFVFVSDALLPQVRDVSVDLQTQASDHQPVRLVLDGARGAGVARSRGRRRAGWTGPEPGASPGR
jgi:endonuclease/exonuclease/phosphatase family metal-dependent hydrolase